MFSSLFVFLFFFSTLLKKGEQFVQRGGRRFESVCQFKIDRQMKLHFSNPRLASGTNRRNTILGMGALEGSPMELCEENAELVIEEVRRELGTIFGYDPASQAVGITGKIELVEVDGPTIVVSLNGRFWHATDTVMMRVESFVKQRIPEVIDVVLSMEKSDIQDDNRLNTGKLF